MLACAVAASQSFEDFNPLPPLGPLAPGSLGLQPVMNGAQM